jgi:molybdopterin-containing oxidoreductase family iron-sulfur binding subunit
MSTEIRVDLASVRRRLDGTRGRHYWKSLEELAETPGFQEFLHREFPQNAAEWTDPKGRREFLRIMSASLALAGLTACTRQPTERIVPYVKAPEDMVPGRPQFFATSLPAHGYAKGVLVESHMGRPTKIEGNELHPASLGATDLFGQAAILELYDPDRSQTVEERGEVRPWGTFLTVAKSASDAHKALKGAGLRLLTETVTSPTLVAQIEALLAEQPEARWHQYEPAGFDAARLGAQLAFGEPTEVHYRLERADVVLSLDADFVGRGAANVRAMRDFASRRKLAAGQKINRLYAIESSPSLTGAMADHRLGVRASEVEGLARALAKGLGLAVEGASDSHADWIAPLVRDLQKHAGACVVLVGESQPASVHAVALAINNQLGNIGTTVICTAPVAARPTDGIASLKELVADMQAGKVDTLVVLGGNPAYNAPVDVPFAAALDKVALRIHHGLYRDETAVLCHWHVPAAHALESWSDLRAFDGSASIAQPLIAPLYEGKSAHEVVAALAGRATSSYDAVRAYWQAQWPTDFEPRWRRALHDGLVADSALPAKPVTLTLGDWARARTAAAPGGLELVFRPDPSVDDGRHANSGWLQELPKALTKITWENAVLLSPRTAERLGVSIGASSRGAPADEVELRYQGRALRGPAWIVPGHPDDTVTVHLGYGRKRAGRVGDGLGFDAYALRTSDAPWFGGGLEVVRTGGRRVVACTQDHWTMEVAQQVEARHLIRRATVEEYERNPHFAAEQAESPAKDMTLYPAFKYDGHAWGLVVDLNSCSGCNACVVACQSENNIPVVGKQQVTMGREMHWLRVDRYYSGGLDAPDTQHQPVMCMQCENAPCETVCPVAATTHSDEGLNDMVYNRCVGTRYCSNNCPYKVRRFNFFLYQDWDTPSLKLMRNPDVTVRSRGVMEKCTYCVQRINQKRIDAKNEGRPLKDGEIRTACQQVCPAEAIVFGDINDPESRVAQLKRDPRNYGLLEDLNTRPRTTYLASVRNPNPEMPHV